MILAGLIFYITRPTEEAQSSSGQTSGQEPSIVESSANSTSSERSNSPSSESTPVLEPTETPSPKPPSLLDRPKRVDQDSDEVEVEGSSGGKRCDSAEPAVAYGYPAASCKLWQPATGLLTGEVAKKGTKKVACQRNLKRKNHVYKSGQTNTWWVWTTSASGTWDWFPETAVAQGVADQPINGVALCQR